MSEELKAWRKDLRFALKGMVDIAGLLKGLATTVTLLEQRIETLALPLRLSLEHVEEELLKGDE